MIKRVALIFATAYAITGLLFFCDLFLAFLMGRSMVYSEPSKIIAFFELISSVASFAILSVFFLEVSLKKTTI